VSRAQAALSAHDARAALAILDQHAALYPHGQLAEEREGLRVLAACTLDKREGRDRANAFLRLRPSSPLAGRIRAACGL
jgi:RNA polymerase sigma-70 factor (ECF subfamily)